MDWLTPVEILGLGNVVYKDVQVSEFHVASRILSMQLD